MKSFLLGLVCFFMVILLAKVSTHLHWEDSEAMTNLNFTISDRDMEEIMTNLNFTYVVDVRNTTTDVIPSPTHGSSDHCERIFVNGVSRKVLGSFTKIYRVLLIPTPVISHDWHDKAQICIHGDASQGLCQCDKDDWIQLGNRLWSFVMPPYEKKIVDIRFANGILGDVRISLDQGSQGWRFFFLAMGTTLLFLAPSVNKYILSRDVDDMAGLFIKWVLHVIAVACIFQSSIDTSMAMVAVVTCLALYWVGSTIKT